MGVDRDDSNLVNVIWRNDVKNDKEEKLKIYRKVTFY